MRKILALSFIAFALFHCRKVERIEKIGSIDPKMSMNCVLESDHFIEVYLNKSLSVLDNAPLKEIKNALVLVYEDGILLDTAEYTTGYYELPYIPKAGSTYRIVASAKGYPTVEATSLMQMQIQDPKLEIFIPDRRIDSSSFGGSMKYYNGYFKKGEIRCSFNDDASQSNRYMIEITENWTQNASVRGYYGATDWNCDKDGVEKVSYYDWTTYEGGTYFFLKDDLLNGQKIDLVFKTSGDYNTFLNSNSLGTDSLISFDISVYSLTDDFYRHVYTLKLNEQNGDNPFEEPVQIYSNVKNGYGILGSQSKSLSSILFPY